MPEIPLPQDTLRKDRSQPPWFDKWHTILFCPGQNSYIPTTECHRLDPMPSTPHPPPTHEPCHGTGQPIAVVERETGLAKETLRVWEKRYGFPVPLRDANGDRLYPRDQVRRLQLIRRLMDTGLRPGKLALLDVDALQSLLTQSQEVCRPELSRTDKNLGPSSLEVQALLDTIAAHNPPALRHALSHAQLRMGLAAFVTDLAAPLAIAVGEAWAQGRFEIFEEHLFTEVMAGVLRSAISALPAALSPEGPRVLLTTLPQELHGLGLLMVEALLVLDGCTCISLGTQTPIGDVVRAAHAHRADVVGLGFSNTHNPAVVLASLRELRSQLPDTTALWAGGACTALDHKPMHGITAVRSLAQLRTLAAQWRIDSGEKSI